ncbi:hypothetical protein PHYSODRAFT_303255 [Phytophthora sojae]|uniref:Uncharacterized protein n=1 Tax=Phytophthora sojae (strain P6497) TaxID=1094619 RepID=G4ZRR1_PHYSP|nr:hypothetical protein PHYSODRAFT_303255 [Phytophthora sojae]EGZ13870.1 hypothetical protein PHYSODRAFT_303255 [Phytophthora sojae]|eukprot:XP_009531299.1 hypothetical protein PHYSODRAFT_303255 [Phytophthora sojae]
MKRFGLKLRSTARIRNAVTGGNLSLVKWFYQNRFEICEPGLAVEYGYLTVAFWLSEGGYKMDLSKLLEGVPLSLHVVRRIMLSSSYVDLARWLCESDRVELLLSTLKNENEIYAWWLLTHTRFEQETSQIKIRTAIQETTSPMRKWLMATIDDAEVNRLGLSGKRTMLNGDVASEQLLPPSK